MAIPSFLYDVSLFVSWGGHMTMAGVGFRTNGILGKDNDISWKDKWVYICGNDGRKLTDVSDLFLHAIHSLACYSSYHLFVFLGECAAPA